MEPADRLSLLWVWASISAASWRVPVAGSRTTSLTPLPPAPGLSLSPPYSIFVPGERVRLTCSPPEGWRAEEFWFYKLKPGDQWDLQLRQKEGTWELEVSTAHLEPQTTFVCTYSVGKSAGELLQSAQSNLCPVSILERPRPPLFSVSPKQEVYRSGEFVSLTCLALGSRHVSKTTFLKDSRRLHVTQDNFMHPFRLLPQDGGTYSCRYQVVESEREIPSPTSNVVRISVMADMVPESSTTILAAHTYETIAGVTNSPGAPMSPALQVTSSSQPVVEEDSHSVEPDGPATSLPRSSQPTSHDGIFSSTHSQSTTKPRDSRGTTKPFDSQGSGTTFTNRGDPRSTSQTRTVSEAGNGNGTPPPGESLDLPLVVGCSAAGVLLLVFLAYLFRRKLKGNSKRLSRSFWETRDHQQSRMTSRIKHPSRTHLDLQEMDPDWRILPKSKAASPRHGDPSKQSKADDNADSGAEFEFLDINPTYTLLGYPCSTFFQAESKPPARDTHIYEEPSR